MAIGSPCTGAECSLQLEFLLLLFKSLPEVPLVKFNLVWRKSVYLLIILTLSYSRLQL